MKHIQIPFVTGYLTISIKGHLPERFFQICIDHDIPVWQVKKISRHECQANIRLQDVAMVEDLLDLTDYELTVVQRRGIPVLFRSFISRKELVMSLIFSVLLLIGLSNIVWDIEITGVSTDIETRMEQQLEHYGIHRGSLIYQIDQPAVIQQRLLQDIPELLWVGIERKGTRYFFEGVEKTLVKKKEVPGPRHLVATKKGVIQQMYVSKGLPQVNVHDYVEPGQVLVSGIIKDVSEESANHKDENAQEEPILVPAEGYVKAKTWYEVDVTVPLIEEYETLTGNREYQYFIGIDRFMIPVWGFKKSEFQHKHIEKEDMPLSIMKWETPLYVVKSTISEKTYHERERSVEEAIATGIEQAKHELLLQLGVEAEILSEKVLHQSVENGKVNLKLYITVLEDIAEAEPIT